MVQNSIDPRDVYELVENDKGELMVVLFASEQPPANPCYYLNEEERCIELSRSSDDVVLIGGLVDATIKKLKALSQIYVCEMKYSGDEGAEDEILYVYAADLKKKTRRNSHSSKKVYPKKPAKQEKKS